MQVDVRKIKRLELETQQAWACGWYLKSRQGQAAQDDIKGEDSKTSRALKLSIDRRSDPLRDGKGESRKGVKGL